MDFTLSGQVSRTLFVADTDASTSGTIRDNNGATRVRANGSSELDDGSTVGIQFEYAVDAGVTLRHANVQLTNDVAGRITVGQGSEAGDGSAGLGPGVTGIGAGQDGTGLGAYFGSLDGGGRTEMIRYDTPAIGPMRAAVSVGNDDSISALLALSSTFSGTTFGAQVGTHHMARPDAPSTRDPSQISASVGLTLASGLSVGGAWGRGDDLQGLPAQTATVAGGDNAVQAPLLAAINAAGAGGRTVDSELADLTVAERAAAAQFIAANPCQRTPTTATTIADALGHSQCTTIFTGGETSVDPSYFRMGIGYTFGDTTVAGSWYNSEDFVVAGSEGTAFGIGASHALPKAGATLHVSVQNYEVELPGMPDMDETVFQLGALVTF